MVLCIFLAAIGDRLVSCHSSVFSAGEILMRRLALLFVLMAGVAPARATVITTDDIDLSDYNVLAANFSPAGYGAVAVPEPASACLLLAGLLLLLARVGF
jgi:hypothetical protein